MPLAVLRSGLLGDRDGSEPHLLYVCVHMNYLAWILQSGKALAPAWCVSVVGLAARLLNCLLPPSPQGWSNTRTCIYRVVWVCTYALFIVMYASCVNVLWVWVCIRARVYECQGRGAARGPLYHLACV